MAGIIFAYIGAFTRWLLGGMKGSVTKYFIGDDDDDLSSHFSGATINRIIGIIVFIITIALIGYIQKF